MENARLRMKIEIVCNSQRCTKLINFTSFKHCIHYDEERAAVHLHKEKIKFDKPVYVRFLV